MVFSDGGIKNSIDKLGELEKLSAENEELIKANRADIEKLAQAYDIVPANFSDLTLTLNQVQEFYRILTKGPIDTKLRYWDIDSIMRNAEDRTLNKEVKKVLSYFMEVDFPAFFLRISLCEPDWNKVMKSEGKKPESVKAYNDLPEHLFVGRNGYSVDAKSNAQTKKLRHSLSGLDVVFKTLNGQIDLASEYNFGYLTRDVQVSAELSIQELPGRQFQLQPYTPKVNYLGNARYFAITESVPSVPSMSGG